MKAFNLNMDVMYITLLPRKSKRVPFVGSFISVRSNTATQDVIVSADSGASTPLPSGMGIPTVRLSDDETTHVPAVFSYVDFYNPSGTETMTIGYVLSLGVPTDSNIVVQGYLQIDQSAPKIETAAALTVPNDGEPAVLQADRNIKERLVTNVDQAIVWFGDETVDPDTFRGTPIQPDGVATIPCWGAVHFKASGAPGKVAVNNIKKI